MPGGSGPDCCAGKIFHHLRGAAAGPDKAMKNALYSILFLGQTLGDVTILFHLVPLYRQLLTSGLDQKLPPRILVFAALGVIIIQVCYWLDLHWFATLRLGHNPLLGHVILFLSRLNFIFAAAVFSAVYLVRFNKLASLLLSALTLFRTKRASHLRDFRDMVKVFHRAGIEVTPKSELVRRT